MTLNARSRPLEDRTAGAPPSALQVALAARIMRLVKDQGLDRGHRLVEQELCDTFGVSRSPIRGALNLLALRGAVETRARRGYILVEPVSTERLVETQGPKEDADQDLMVAIAAARNEGRLPDSCSMTQLCRMFSASPTVVNSVLRRLMDLGLVERRPGRGWAFKPLIDSAIASAESYAFRRAIEPAALTQDTFRLDSAWAKDTRSRHQAFRIRPWSDFRAVEFYEMNSDFHEQLARCSGNRMLLDSVRRQILLRSFLNYQWRYGRARVLASIDEHMKILNALEAGNPQLASDHMICHLTSSAMVKHEWHEAASVGGAG
ncbi:MAG TPA: GntR family transcriptional regulator [Caulobacteraceae bacterium]|jgi:DNA-binding GntR family transcriptional regulator